MRRQIRFGSEAVRVKRTIGGGPSEPLCPENCSMSKDRELPSRPGIE